MRGLAFATVATSALGWMAPARPPLGHISAHSGGYREHCSLRAVEPGWDEAEMGGVESKAVIQWYPGHVAKAEKQLVDCLQRVDVVVELRDARIPEATAHPLVDGWVGNAKPRIVVFARKDMVPGSAVAEWHRYLTSKPDYNGAPIFWVDGKRGAGVRELKRAVLSAGEYVNKRRENRGIRPRPVRAAVIGFPNVGKSALINQLVGKKRAVSENRPGVTRSLQWIRIGGDNSQIELLDSPGIIPAKQVDQNCALKLAICNDIGEASYDSERVAASMVELLRATHSRRSSFVSVDVLADRYGVDPRLAPAPNPLEAIPRPPTGPMTGEDFLALMADKHHQGDMFVAAQRILADFRKGLLGKLSLDVPGNEAAWESERKSDANGRAGERVSEEMKEMLVHGIPVVMPTQEQLRDAQFEGW